MTAEPTTPPRDRALALLALCAPAAAQEVPTRPAVAIVRTDEPPVIDGRMDEAVWSLTPVIDDFVQVEPGQGRPPSERTEVRLLFDDDAVYIGIRCFDSDPSAIVATEMKRDASLGSDDHVRIVFDTFADRRNGYFFAVGAAGARRDGTIERGRLSTEWDGLWVAKTSIDDEGWTAEIAIPTKTVAFDQRGGNDHRRLNAGAVLRLARHSLRGGSTDAADAESGAEHGQAGSEAGADETVSLAGRVGRLGLLQQSEHFEHVGLHSAWEMSEPVARPPRARRVPRLGVASVAPFGRPTRPVGLIRPPGRITRR